MLINCDPFSPLYVLGDSVQSEELARFVNNDHKDVQLIHHEAIGRLPHGAQCVIGFTNIDYRIALINNLKSVLKWPTYVHPTALVESTASIGIGCLIYPLSTVMHSATIGNFSAICTHVHISHGIKTGENVIVCPGTVIGGSTVIGDNVFIGQTSSIRDKISICSNTRFGIASVVSKNISIPGTYVGNKKANITL
jgi:UDP-3-O-[3-hydroxymyristoyl] glucosamine N-acyltransferase